MQQHHNIYIAGHTGLLGSALLHKLTQADFQHLLYRTHAELDLTQQSQVNHFFATERPDYVFLCAAKVGGIYANNTYRGDFIYQNLAIQTNIIEASRQYGVKRLLFFGSACSYPRDCSQPMKENDLLTGPLEPTNEAYAVAKIAGIKLCEAYNMQYGTDFAIAIPTNLYGSRDKFDSENSHVLPALLQRIHLAKENGEKSITIWGTGTPKREFLYVDDMADASVFLMQQKGYTQMINVGSGQEVSIAEVTQLMCEVIGYQGKIIYDTSKPDGAPRKWLDSARIQELGWQAKTDLKTGLTQTYQWYLSTLEKQAVA